MKSVVNKTRKPLRIPLPRGKTLHLGPGKSGQIAHQDLDHEPLQRLVKEGTVEIRDAGPAKGANRDLGRAPHESTHGHHAPAAPQVKGDR